MPRVVSLVPSVTETLVALHAPPVGCTRFCEQPGIPTVGGTKNPDLAAVERLLPHVVIVNDEENRKEDVDALDDMGLTVVSVSPRSVDDAGPAVAAIARAGGAAVPDGFEGDAWAQWLAGWRRPAVTRRAFVPVWARPWITLNAQTYGSSLLALLGVENIFQDADDRYPEVRLDDARARAPDLVLLPTEPYPFKAQHLERMEEAFPDAAVTIVDGQDLFWWGIRTPQAIARLAGTLDRIALAGHEPADPGGAPGGAG